MFPVLSTALTFDLTITLKICFRVFFKKINKIMYEEQDDFLEFVDVAIQENLQRVPKRYIRDAENPLEFYNAEEFRTRYRFQKETVIDAILPLVFDGLHKNDNRGLPIPPIIQLLTCLRFYATCNFQVVSGDLRGISQATISGIIKKVSGLIAEHLREYVRFPHTPEGFRSNIRKFYDIANFPTVSGCVDCTHIRISNPGGDNGEVFRNRKRYFSLNVQVIAGPNREIMDIVVRHPGSSHDSVIFDRSPARVKMERGDIPGLLLGDNGYACRHYLLTPLLQPVTPAEVRYNASHIRTRNIVERVFGIWKKRFPCLQRGLQTKLETSVAIICATAVFYNIGLREYRDFQENVIEEIPARRNLRDAERGLDFRRHFIETYFGN